MMRINARTKKPPHVVPLRNVFGSDTEDAPSPPRIIPEQQEEPEPIESYNFDESSSSSSVKPSSSSGGGSKYMDAMRLAAAERNRARDIAMNRVASREARSSALTGWSTEEFVTGAYKQRLEEDRVFEQELKRRAETEKDVTSGAGMGGFYQAVLCGNIMKQEEKQTSRAVVEKSSVTSTTSKKLDDEKEKKEVSRPVVTVESRKRTSESVQSAKERYLQRKANKIAQTEKQNMD